ncbi:MAG: hypothetical protein A2W00_01770 [Candidatus Eisenbacteria bacterium RBG_16_71_46]|nr:MAG: hypothetical protein A2W00_01770 [Candidatus Eisenbacteria bacterium RBG_16_71_46]
MLEPDSGSVVDQLRIAFAPGLPHPPGIPIRDASARIGRFVAILQATRRLPHPPMLLRDGPWFEVLDGNHRLAALFVALANGVPVESLRETWVATVRPS